MRLNIMSPSIVRSNLEHNIGVAILIQVSVFLPAERGGVIKFDGQRCIRNPYNLNVSSLSTLPCFLIQLQHNYQSICFTKLSLLLDETFTSSFHQSSTSFCVEVECLMTSCCISFCCGLWYMRKGYHQLS